MNKTVERSLAITDDGLVLGHTILAKFGNGSLRINESAVLTLLSIASGKIIPPSELGYIRCAEKYHQYGDDVMCGIALALTGVPILQKIQQVEKLYSAETLLCHGVTPLELLKIAGIEDILADTKARELYKFTGGDLCKEYDPDQPRVPAGNGEESGRWTGEGGGQGKNLKWGDLRTLEKHYKDHKDDFGAASEEDYAIKANQFLDYAKQNNLPMIEYPNGGEIGVYDPETNTFGLYNADGATITFYKPTSSTYFAREAADVTNRGGNIINPLPEAPADSVEAPSGAPNDVIGILKPFDPFERPGHPELEE